MRTVGERVYESARDRLGQQVGAGAPWELVHYALRRAGLAHTATRLHGEPVGDWGDPIGVLDASPGDVIELDQYELIATTLHTALFDDGSRSVRSEQTSRAYASHVAIVATRPRERSVGVLEQVGGRVRERVLLLRDSGPIVQRTFQWERDGLGRVRPSTIVQRTILRVTGTARAFRPYR